MNTAKETAIRFFKRNPNAFAAHIVLMQAFSNATAASKYRKAVSARVVTAILRSECAEELGEKINASPQPSATVEGETLIEPQ